MSEARRRGLLWLALAIAFSPVLQDLAVSLVREPEHRYVLVAPLLMGCLLLSSPRSVGAVAARPARTLGLVLLALALLADVERIAGWAWLIAAKTPWQSPGTIGAATAGEPSAGQTASRAAR